MRALERLGTSLEDAGGGRERLWDGEEASRALGGSAVASPFSNTFLVGCLSLFFPFFDRCVFCSPEEAAKTRVLDVRDYDFEGGHVRGCVHVPASSFYRDEDVDRFIASLPDSVDHVIVHCFFSMQRGPFTASRIAQRLRAGAGRGDVRVDVLKGGWRAAAKEFGEVDPHRCDCDDGRECAQD